MDEQTRPREPRELSTRELLAQISDGTRQLVKEEIALAKTELRTNLRSEIWTVGGMSMAAICGLCALCLALVAAGFALGLVLPTWGALLIIAGVVAAIGAGSAAVGWRKRVRSPLGETRESLKEDMQWAKRGMH
jgi:hypothetical protein